MRSRKTPTSRTTRSCFVCCPIHDLENATGVTVARGRRRRAALGEGLDLEEKETAVDGIPLRMHDVADALADDEEVLLGQFIAAAADQMVAARTGVGAQGAEHKDGDDDEEGEGYSLIWSRPNGRRSGE